MNAIRVVLIGAMVGAVVSAPAWASHGKAGLWEIKIQSDMGQMPGMPDMSKLPPEVQARMKAAGVQMNGGGGMTVQHCMTQAEVNAQNPNMTHNASCKATNVQRNGQSFSADIVCTGHMNGTGHVQFTFDSPEHYYGSESMTGTAEGHPVSHSMKMDARWISADCGSVQH